MKVAATQFAPKFKEKPANIQVMTKLVLAAARGGAQLVVLPEMATTGYSFQSEGEARPFAEALHASSPTLTSFQLLAEQLQVAIAWGMLTERPQGDLHNSQVLALPDGRWVAYDKVNLWGNDFLAVKPGSGSPPVVKFQGKKIGLLICRDVRDKTDTWDDLYEKGDADIVCFSANWGDGGFPSVRWVNFARNNEVFFVVGNRFGKERNNNFGEGGICVIEPCGKVHCEGLEWGRACIVLADIDQVRTNSFKLTLIDGRIFDCERQLRFQQVAWRRQVIQQELDRLKS